jgi:recyclin-1
VIADLNAYHAFVLALKIGGSQNGQQLAQDFAAFKMLGHVYIVEDAKDLAAIVRDTARYGGRFRPEVSCNIRVFGFSDTPFAHRAQDVYEFIQRRSDWKKIERTVDKTMYNLSFKEDCIIS